MDDRQACDTRGKSTLKRVPLPGASMITLTVNGAMTLATGDTLTLDASQEYSITQLVVNGTLSAASTTFYTSVTKLIVKRSFLRIR